MKIMIIGGGGREHALAWKLKKSPLVSHIICVPGNAGIEEIAECVPWDLSDCEGLSDLAKQNGVDITIVGPEAPLSLGIVDTFNSKGLKIFGPSKDAAILESSKSFAKELMKESGIPTPDFAVFTDCGSALEYAKNRGFPIVVKADGIAAGKGVIICQNLRDTQRAVQKIIIEKAFGAAGNKIILEDLLTGEEASFLAFTDGKTVLPMASSQDHKSIREQDQGPNTGGMGAYSPAPVITPEIHKKIMDKIMLPVVRGMTKRGITYKGVLYAGLMIKDNEPFVLEFNCRFGDPETQPILLRMEDDLMPVIQAVIKVKLSGVKLSWSNNAAVCVVAVSSGYPDVYEKGKEISGLKEVSKIKGVTVFHSGTRKEGRKVLTNGGRVLGVTALGSDLRQAVDKAYKAIDLIQFEGIYFRRDIAQKGLRRLGLF
ncbi:phosphoribosylamine--glycine ligase [bacterium]|nr:phosphoribosylamine--glycine ligase [bacterium]